jgi:hypothetical protein
MVCWQEKDKRLLLKNDETRRLLSDENLGRNRRGCCTNLIICAAFSFYCISILEKNGMNV